MGAIPTEVTSLQLLASQSAHTTQDSEQSYESQVAPLAGALLFLNAGLTPARRSLGAGDARSGAAHLQEKGTDLAHVHVQRMVQTTFKRSSAGRWALHFAPRKQHRSTYVALGDKVATPPTQITDRGAAFEAYCGQNGC